MLATGSGVDDGPMVIPPDVTVIGRPLVETRPSPGFTLPKTTCHSPSDPPDETIRCRPASESLESASRDGTPTSGRTDADRLIGTLIGKFRIESVIASGGMGTVYKAIQEHPVRRPVALKMIKAGLADPSTLSRFIAERQVLALMDHPDIARVYEADATSDGNPYLAMEFCDGLPIDEYCREKQLNVRQRVELVVRIARAVSRAHAHGVVHRDLKPGNVLIADDADRPPLKIIDFGIAKWTAEQPGLQVHATQIGELVGTPAYMSPEQAAGDIDARTDVFALGAILFKLLTGSTPLPPPAMANPGLVHVIQHIQSFQGLTPTQRFRELPPSEQQQLVLELNLEKTAQWHAAIRGELDWITLRSIEPDRTRRYATASDFADDLERYLRHEPVVAAAPSRWYRWTKFYQRRKTLVWALATVAVVLGLAAAFSGYTWWSYQWQAWNENQRMTTEAQVWLTEAKTRQVDAFADPTATETALVTARTAAARAETLLQGRDDSPALHQSLSELQLELAHAQAGFTLASALDMARHMATESGGMEAGDQFGRLAGLRQMQVAWEQFGIVPVETNADVAARKILTLPLTLQPRLVEALDFLLYEDPFGAGLYLHQQGSRISIAEVVHGGGAERAAQLRPGDRVLQVDDVSLVDWTANDELRAQAYRLLAGKPGQQIRVTFVRGLSEPLETEIVCGGSAAHWAQEVLAQVDTDPWRTRLRRAVLAADLKQLHELRTGTEFSLQPPFNLIQLAGTLFLLERTNESLRFLELAQQQHPQNFWANHYLGTALATAHEPPRPDLGVRYLTSAVALRPDSPGARINLAETLLQLGHEQEAIAHFETAKRLSPNHVPVAQRLRYLLDRASVSSDLENKTPTSDRAPKSQTHPTTETATTTPSSDFAALTEVEQRARLLASQGQRRDALALVRQAEEYHQTHAPSNSSNGAAGESPEITAMLRRIKGVVLLELQDFVAARVVLADAARLNPGDAATRFYHGVALEHSGDSENAIHEYEAALQIRPDYEAVREFLRNLKQP